MISLVSFLTLKEKFISSFYHFFNFELFQKAQNDFFNLLPPRDTLGFSIDQGYIEEAQNCKENDKVFFFKYDASMSVPVPDQKFQMLCYQNFFLFRNKLPNTNLKDSGQS